MKEEELLILRGGYGICTCECHHMALKKAIYTAGSRRLKPILMVAMASLVSTIPMLFGSGIGSELQRPMALALVGGMSLGTVVSFFIPLAYWYIYRKRVS